MRRRILIVEDDPHSRKGLQDSLLADGHGVEAVSDGWQAFRKIKEGVFDLAIVDLELPPVLGIAITGWDLVRILRAYFPGIPIVILSSQEDAAIRRLLDRFKVSTFLVKPIDPARIRATARSLEEDILPVPVVECTMC
jgi:DNA-binding response OmpR family regulator